MNERKSYPVRFYKKTGSLWNIDGGRLRVTEREYVLKCFWRTVARFPRDKAVLQRLPDENFLPWIRIRQGGVSYDLSLSRKHADALYRAWLDERRET